MGLPRDGTRSGQHSPNNPAIPKDADNGQKQSADLALKKGERGQITEETENQSAGADMIRVPADQPGQDTGKNDSQDGNDCKFVAPSQAENDSKQSKSHTI